MQRAEVVHQCYRSGGGRVMLRKRHGGWRTIRFDSAPTALGKLLGLASVLSRIGGATTAVAGGVLLVAQVAGTPAVRTPAAPRDGPVRGPVQITGP